MAVGVRDRTRDLLRAQFAAAVLAVFLQRGYSSVTVEDAAREAGISRATFFRYFGSKEDVVVAAVESSSLDHAAALRALPADTRMSGWQLVRLAIEPVITVAAEDPDGYRARLRLIMSEPALTSRLRERRAESAVALAEALAERIPDEFTARVLANAALAAVDIAWERWAVQDNVDLGAMVDAALERLSSAAYSIN
ncbi:TetR family transcriptional regulator [Microbacterium sp. KSW2-21]|uniref:TetR family transcriptional regulator n=1 Tax=Microbacterium algihabitans TaxID=3075992 RepID=A0ABU3RZY3_9MICO|nr:TetR family transcriptional regulator [Microbacterium sp. KSW2-21]MDU0328427.1 TetR family transcriptional regulator [Microbacterium sp. KSW2-21]